ncbi:glycoside hydrolase family 93 protein [Hypoxylon fragiforme]|uniref:glycoside hydrolase family 93 protein n=1 Tax=Hypoxylon fragiforme TaxID=63214 RepID=UPI0020C6944C|nr:glycoside hydrolase family 93 protein [Hypoxylon fragiforme]KAI2608716.1 glycoside hydrolase family 93 protein [Hypoxylon fragiforme]
MARHPFNNTPLLLLLLLNFLFLASAIPIARDDTKQITSRDETINFNEIGASFTLGSAETTVATQGTYPRMVRLADNGILAISTVRGADNLRILTITRSDDNGRTFAQIGEVARSTGEMDNGFLLKLASGSLLAAFRNHDLNAARALTYFRITVCRSDDGGRSWYYVQNAFEQPASADGYNGLWEPFMRIARDGSVQLFYSGELSRTNQETFRVVSTDEGRTWTAPVNLRLHGTDQQFRDGMTGIAATTDAADGRDALVMVFEVQDGTFFHLATVLSYDDGITWGTRTDIYSAPQHNAGAPQIKAVGNNLAVVFMTDEDTPAGQLNWAQKADIKMIFSTQLSGASVRWSTQTMHLSEDSSYWPGLFQIDPNTLLAAYERGGVSLARFVTKV